VLYKFPEIDNGIPAALAQLDDRKRADMIKKMEKFLYDQVASISLWDGVSVFAMRKNVQYRPIEHRMPFVTLQNVKVAG
jgi:ABC-type transport system substrate-binding protein